MGFPGHFTHPFHSAFPCGGKAPVTEVWEPLWISQVCSQRSPVNHHLMVSAFSSNPSCVFQTLSLDTTVEGSISVACPESFSVHQAATSTRSLHVLRNYRLLSFGQPACPVSTRPSLNSYQSPVQQSHSSSLAPQLSILYWPQPLCLIFSLSTALC